MPRYVLYSGRDKLDTFNLGAKARVVIGRAEDADVRIDNPAVSRHHAEVRKTGSSYILQDLSGKNGVFVNGRMVNTQRLKDQDRIEILKYTLVFEYGASEAELDRAHDKGGLQSAFKIGTGELLEATDEAGGRRRGAARLTDKGSAKEATFTVSARDLAALRSKVAQKQQAHLEVHVGRPVLIPLQGRESTAIGRGPEAQARLPGPFWMGATQAIVRRRKEGYTVERGAGLSWVRVNGTRLARGEVRDLEDGDVLLVGPHRVVFHAEL